MTVTRLDIAEAVLGTFGGSSASVRKADLLRTARDRGAESEVLVALESLPERPFRTLNELWTHLPEVPVV